MKLAILALLGASTTVLQTEARDIPEGLAGKSFTVGVTAPATNYKVEIKGVYKIGDEVWVVSKVGTVGDIGGQAITKVRDSVKVDSADLPAGEYKVRHKVLGKSWGWDEKGDGVEHIKKEDEAALKKQLAAGKKIEFKR